MSDRNEKLVFWGCFIALITTSFAFITRAFLVNIPDFWPTEFGLDQEALLKALAESKAEDVVKKHLGGKDLKKLKKKDVEKAADELLKGILKQ